LEGMLALPACPYRLLVRPSEMTGRQILGEALSV
jgi:hypothetical protein